MLLWLFCSQVVVRDTSHGWRGEEIIYLVTWWEVGDMGSCVLQVPSQSTFLLPPFRVLWLSAALFPGFSIALSGEKQGERSLNHLIP